MGGGSINNPENTIHLEIIFHTGKFKINRENVKYF